MSAEIDGDMHQIDEALDDVKDDSTSEDLEDIDSLVEDSSVELITKAIIETVPEPIINQDLSQDDKNDVIRSLGETEVDSPDKLKTILKYASLPKVTFEANNVTYTENEIIEENEQLPAGKSTHFNLPTYVEHPSSDFERLKRKRV